MIGLASQHVRAGSLATVEEIHRLVRACQLNVSRRQPPCQEAIARPPADEVEVHRGVHVILRGPVTPDRIGAENGDPSARIVGYQTQEEGALLRVEPHTHRRQRQRAGEQAHETAWPLKGVAFHLGRAAVEPALARPRDTERLDPPRDKTPRGLHADAHRGELAVRVAHAKIAGPSLERH